MLREIQIRKVVHYNETTTGFVKWLLCETGFEVPDAEVALIEPTTLSDVYSAIYYRDKTYKIILQTDPWGYPSIWQTFTTHPAE